MSGQYSPEDTARGDDADAELKAEAVPPATLDDVVKALSAIAIILRMQQQTLEVMRDVQKKVADRR